MLLLLLEGSSPARFIIKDRCLLWNDHEMNYSREDVNVLQNSTWVCISALICMYLRESKHWDAMILSLVIVKKFICPLKEPRKKMEVRELSSQFCCIL